MRRMSRIIAVAAPPRQTQSGNGATWSSSARDLVHRRLQHRGDALHRDRGRRVAAPGRVVDDDADRRVGQLELARERRLGHAGHADQRRAVALHPVDLGRGLEPRALTPRRRRRRRSARCRPRRAAARHLARSAGVYGCVKSTWTTLLVAAVEERRLAIVRVVDELVRQRRGRRVPASRMPPTEATASTAVAPRSFSAHRLAR